MSEDINIAVIGLDDFHRELLQSVRGAEDYRFHGVIPYEKIVNPKHYPIEELLNIATHDIEEIKGGVDAIIGHWDFPTTSILPILQGYYGLKGPSLESALTCENKYAARMAAVEVEPYMSPEFALIDPQDEGVLDDPPLPFPFWLKPVVAFSSTLGFRIEGRDDLEYALKQIRSGIGKFAEPFDVLRNRARLGDKRAMFAGGYCVAEGIVNGRGCTLEGYVVDGQPKVYATIDSLRASNGVSFLGYHYPSDLPDHVVERMFEGTYRILRHIGLDDTPFNIEFLWEEASDSVKLLEINARISKSHSPIFYLAEGASHHEVAIDVALGREPQFPSGKGRYKQACKFMPRTFGAAEVVRAPSESDIERLQEVFPDAMFTTYVREGMNLENLPNQDSYSFELGDLFLGAGSREELTENFGEAMKILDFRFSHDVETNYD